MAAEAHARLYARSWSTPTSDAANSGTRLSVLQFNVLADSLCAQMDNCGGFAGPRDSMEWEQRRTRLIEVVTRHGALPDIVGMEEVDHFTEWLEPQMAALGYAGVWAKKPKEKSKDGSALFWQTGRLALRGEVEVQRFVEADGSGANQIALLATLDVLAAPLPPAAAAAASAPPVPPAAAVFVVVTHLKASKDAKGELDRAQQIVQLFDRVAALRGDLPCIAVMDMNAAPETSASAPYPAAAYPAALSHGALRVGSAYARALGSEPAWTTWKRRVGAFKAGEAKHTIDYIFTTADIAVTRVLNVPDDASVVETRLPGWEYPSDHVALRADLVLL